MSLVVNLRGPQGAAGTLTSLLALTWVNNAWVIGCTNPSLGFNKATGTVTFLVAGYYMVDWKNPALFQAANSTVMLPHGTHQVFGPLL